MDKALPVFVAGHRGMAGSAIVRRLQALGYTNLVTAARSELELTDQAAVRRFFTELPAEEKRTIGQKVAKKLRGSLLSGVYAVVNLPADERARSGRNRALASEYGLGATHPDEEMAIIRRGVNQIREDVGAYGIEIPFIAELDGSVH